MWLVATLWDSTDREHFHHQGSSIGQCGSGVLLPRSQQSSRWWLLFKVSPTVSRAPFWSVRRNWMSEKSAFVVLKPQGFGVSCSCSIICSILFTHRFQQISIGICLKTTITMILMPTSQPNERNNNWATNRCPILSEGLYNMEENLMNVQFNMYTSMILRLYH